MYDTSLSLRQRLKLATGPAHVSLEARIGPLTTQLAYNEYVRGLHAFRSAAEDWLSAQDTHGFGAWKPQRISHHLSNDISDLALTPLSVSGLDWAQRDWSYAMGVHYVLEGSALGARILCKQVEELGMHREHGARHLWAQAETLEGWRGFLDLLMQHDGDEEALFAGANAAFDAAAGAMERAAHV
ncbi:MAG: biliverdin-producing heme oxygenase [Hyphomonadaceae bacterium]